MTKNIPHRTSWEPVAKWYDKAVGQDGHYYHTQIVLPKTLNLLNLNANSSLLDLACGDGVLGRSVSREIGFLGLDISPSLIQAAKAKDTSKLHHYEVRDVAKPFSLDLTFSHATCILALQNIEHAETVFKNVSKHLHKGGTFVFVLNHPCFRIPRQSSWGIDEEKKLQYRRLDRYMTSMSIPIAAHPSQKNDSPTTVSFHHPLQSFFTWCQAAGLLIQTCEEWCSNKVSEGKAAKMENRSREEFPLFLTIKAIKA